MMRALQFNPKERNLNIYGVAESSFLTMDFGEI
jgi:hypothetical protein